MDATLMNDLGVMYTLLIGAILVFAAFDSLTGSE